MKLDRTLIERSPLTELQKKYLTLVDVEGHGVVETAKLLNRGKSTVSIGHALALKKFNEWMDEADRDSGEEGGAGPEVLKGIGYAERLDTLGVPLHKLPSFIALVEKYGNRAGEALVYALKLKEIEEREGKTYQAVLSDFAEKTAEAELLRGGNERLREEKETLEDSLGVLHELTPLKEELDKHNLTAQRLQAFIDRNLKLDELGFSSHAAEVLGSELQKKGLDPSKAAVLLADMIEHYRTGEEAMVTLTRQKGKLEEQIKTASDKLDTLEGEIGGIEEQLKLKKGQVYDWKQLEEDQKKLHERMMEGRAEEIDDLEGRKETLLGGIERLKEEEGAIQSALLVLESHMRKIEDQLEKTKPIAVIASLTENPKSPLPPSEVAKTLLAIIAGFKSHLDANPRDFTPETRRLVRELHSILAGEVRLAGRRAQ
ncbi:MAG: hypothetical protein HY296_03075 [Thaumarchaeota archaeon]|nr:hypothetical protein [Nitrososphaerota archaeon]